MTDTLEQRAADIAEDFELLDDPEMQLRYVMDMGKKVPFAKFVVTEHTAGRRMTPDSAKAFVEREDKADELGAWVDLFQEPNRVHGCQSTVWLKESLTQEGGLPRVEVIAVADAHIVNGLISLLRKLYNGSSPREIVAFEIEPFLERIGLDKHLSPTRRNGLFEMVKRVRTLAAAHAGNAAAN